jgi:hypothetical protein
MLTILVTDDRAMNRLAFRVFAMVKGCELQHQESTEKRRPPGVSRMAVLPQKGGGEREKCSAQRDFAVAGMVWVGREDLEIKGC